MITRRQLAASRAATPPLVAGVLIGVAALRHPGPLSGWYAAAVGCLVVAPVAGLFARHLVRSGAPASAAQTFMFIIRVGFLVSVAYVSALFGALFVVWMAALTTSSTVHSTTEAYLSVGSVLGALAQRAWLRFR